MSVRTLGDTPDSAICRTHERHLDVRLWQRRTTTDLTSCLLFSHLGHATRQARQYPSSRRRWSIMSSVRSLFAAGTQPQHKLAGLLPVALSPEQWMTFPPGRCRTSHEIIRFPTAFHGYSSPSMLRMISIARVWILHLPVGAVNIWCSVSPHCTNLNGCPTWLRCWCAPFMHKSLH